LIIRIGALLVPCGFAYAQSQNRPLPNQQLAGTQTARSNQPVTVRLPRAGPKKRISRIFYAQGRIPIGSTTWN